MEDLAVDLLRGDELRAVLEAQGLSERRLDIVQAIIEFKQQWGYSPNLDEIMDAAGVYTKSVVSYHVKRLCREGWLTQAGMRGQARTLEVAGGCWRWRPPESRP